MARERPGDDQAADDARDHELDQATEPHQRQEQRGAEGAEDQDRFSMLPLSVAPALLTALVAKGWSPIR